ncbi:MAG: hypothetical protein CL816_07240 [Coxiellaceae bacterium]|nr:hypothetical protein [Coxiellaceae bacterium]|tara:strand:+ start:9756 stop:11621 length:1866 start_codon:yes stop_codon:yes gene_type:complete
MTGKSDLFGGRMIRIADYLTQDTINFFRRLKAKSAVVECNPLSMHSRWVDHVSHLPSSPLVFEFEFACQNQLNRQEWLDACIAEGMIALFDEKGVLQPSIRQRIAELAGSSEEALDDFIYSELPKDSVHMQWLAGYCASLMDRAYRALPEEFLVHLGEAEPDEFSPVSTNSWIIAQLAQKAEHPELFHAYLRDAYLARAKRQDSQLVDYWRRAQQCALEVTSNISSQKTFLKAVRQLHMCLILGLRDQKGDEFTQDDVYDEYERIQKHIGAAVHLSEAKAAIVSQLCEGIGLFSSGGVRSDVVLSYNLDLEEQFKDSPLDLNTEKNLLWHSLVCFAPIGLKKQGRNGGNGDVLRVKEEAALIEPVVQVLQERNSHQDLAQWTVGQSPVSQSWVYRFMGWMLPHVYRLELEAHQIAARSLEDGQDKAQFFINRLNKLSELLMQCQCWMSRHEDLSFWEKLWGGRQRQVSVMSLMQTLHKEIKKGMHELDVINDKLFAQKKSAKDAANENSQIPIKPSSDSTMKSVSNLSMVCMSCFLLSCLTRWVPHPHVGHFAGLMMQLGFSGATGLAFSKGWLSQSLFRQRKSVDKPGDMVSHQTTLESGLEVISNTENVELPTRQSRSQ